MDLPNYFILDQTGNLHAYYREDILRVDIATNRETPPQQIFKLSETGLSVTYNPITIADILQTTPASTQQALRVAA